MLSGNQTAQIERVLTQPYAYINDVTGFELEMSRTCDLGLLDDLFLPAEYAVGLLENSYFTADISAEYVVVTSSLVAACHAFQVFLCQCPIFCSDLFASFNNLLDILWKLYCC